MVKMVNFILYVFHHNLEKGVAIHYMAGRKIQWK